MSRVDLIEQEFAVHITRDVWKILIGWAGAQRRRGEHENAMKSRSNWKKKVGSTKKKARRRAYVIDESGLRASTWHLGHVGEANNNGRVCEWCGMGTPDMGNKKEQVRKGVRHRTAC